MKVSVIVIDNKRLVDLIGVRVRDEFYCYTGFSQIANQVVVYVINLLHTREVWVEDVKCLD
jgi:hypothetical protein